jgi:hypothetical protein
LWDTPQKTWKKHGKTTSPFALICFIVAMLVQLGSYAKIISCGEPFSLAKITCLSHVQEGPRRWGLTQICLLAGSGFFSQGKHKSFPHIHKGVTKKSFASNFILGGNICWRAFCEVLFQILKKKKKKKSTTCKYRGLIVVQTLHFNHFFGLRS